MSDVSTQLKDWLDALSSELDTGGYDMDEEAIHILLDLARDAAHEVIRPAAPLTTFLIGIAVGRGASLGAAAARATQMVQPDHGKIPHEHRAQGTASNPVVD